MSLYKQRVGLIGIATALLLFSACAHQADEAMNEAKEDATKELADDSKPAATSMDALDTSLGTNLADTAVPAPTPTLNENFLPTADELPKTRHKRHVQHFQKFLPTTSVEEQEKAAKPTTAASPPVAGAQIAAASVAPPPQAPQIIMPPVTSAPLVPQAPRSPLPNQFHSAALLLDLWRCSSPGTPVIPH